MTDRVLPALFVVVVIGEALHDELVNTVQSYLSVGGVLDRHRNEGDVRIRWFLVLFPFVQFGEDAERVTLSTEVGRWVAHAGQVRPLVLEILPIQTGKGGAKWEWFTEESAIGERHHGKDYQIT